jgi:G3E family GTPase
MEVPQRGLPVTIVTGFLGSGKTTLLNHILSNQEGIRTAILVNEFGEISIDSELIVSTEEDLVELNNGCLCCTVRGDIADSVMRLLERADGNAKPIDYLVVETTGLADPLPVALTFLGPELRDITRLDSIVTLVDASNFAPDLFASEVADSQITYGDVIVLNKTDLVAASELAKLEKRIRAMKEGARILKATQGAVPLELLLDTDLFQANALPTQSAQEHEHHEHEHHEHEHHEQVHAHHPHSHHLEEDGFNSVAFESDRPLDLDRFQGFLNDLPEAVFRGKGVLWFDESPDRHIFHLSGKRYTVNSDPWPEGKSPKNQLVLIGQHLDTNRLLKRIESCVKQPTAKPTGFSSKR